MFKTEYFKRKRKKNIYNFEFYCQKFSTMLSLLVCSSTYHEMLPSAMHFNLIIMHAFQGLTPFKN